MKTSIKEIEMLTESEKRYRVWERIAEMHGTTTILPEYGVINQPDFKSVLFDKWNLLVNQGGSL